MDFFALAARSAPVGFAWLEPDDMIAVTNDAFVSMCGAASDPVAGRDVLALAHVEDRDRLAAFLRSSRRGARQSRSLVLRFGGGEADPVWVRLSANLLPSPADARSNGLLLTLVDLSAEKEAEIALRRQIDSLDDIWRSASSAIAVLRTSGEIVRVYPGFTRLFGYSSSESLGRRIQDLIGSDDVRDEIETNLAIAARGTSITHEGVRYDRNGAPIHVSILGRAFRLSEDETGVFVMFRDITERIEAEALIQRLSTTDELTGLWNRRGFYALAELAVQRAIRDDSGLVVVYADLDDFKQINDRFGHVEGDRALAEVGYILRSSSRGSDIAARLGGDEFIILGVGHPDGERILADRVRLALETRNRRGDRPYALELSIGTVFVTPDREGFELDAAIAAADRNMYADKARRAATRAISAPDPSADADAPL